MEGHFQRVPIPSWSPTVPTVHQSISPSLSVSPPIHIDQSTSFFFFSMFLSCDFLFYLLYLLLLYLYLFFLSFCLFAGVSLGVLDNCVWCMRCFADGKFPSILNPRQFLKVKTTTIKERKKEYTLHSFIQSLYLYLSIYQERRRFLQIFIVMFCWLFEMDGDVCLSVEMGCLYIHTNEEINSRKQERHRHLHDHRERKKKKERMEDKKEGEEVFQMKERRKDK